MTLSEEECAQKWTLINETLSKIDALIKDITQKHQKAGDIENNIEIAKLYHAAAYAMTELEKCKPKNGLCFHVFTFVVKLRFTLTSEELKDHLIQIEEVI